MDLRKLLEDCVTIAEEAGALIEAVHQNHLDILHKEDDSPVTQADFASDLHIHQALSQLKSKGFDYPCLSEESRSNFSKTTETYWCVDPLDGTKDFIEKTGDYTVNIALLHKGSSILGVIHAPKKKKTYYASLKDGAWVKDAQGTRPIEARFPDMRALVALISRFHSDDALSKALKSYPGLKLKKAGSAIKFCEIAEGEADLYPRITPTHDWDVAAAHCILKACGGDILTLDLKPIEYNVSPPWKLPPFLAVGSMETSWKDFVTHFQTSLRQ